MEFHSVFLLFFDLNIILNKNSYKILIVLSKIFIKIKNYRTGLKFYG